MIQCKFIEPGMDITGRSDWKRIVEVSDDIKEKVIQQTRRNFINGFGMVNDESENFNEFIKSTLKPYLWINVPQLCGP